MRFIAGTTETMNLRGGNVGIGTSNPAFASGSGLEIEKAGIATLRFQNTSSGKSIEITQDSDFKIESMNSSSDILLMPTANVGIGTSNPTNKFGINRTSINTNERMINLYTGTTTANSYVSIGAQYSETNALSNSEIRFGNEATASADSFLAFATGNSSSPTERMRIDSTGDIRFGHTGAYIAADEVYTFYNQQKGRTISIATAGNASHYGIDMWNQVGGSCNQMLFRGGGSGAATGSITSTGNNATQFNTSSDYRLKENVDYTWDALTRLNQLKPCRFNWIDDDTNTLEDGFLAHEVSSVVPNAVTGEKDAVYTEEEAASEMYINAGDIKRQQLDNSKLVPLLVKAIQEQQEQIEELKSEIEALKS